MSTKYNYLLNDSSKSCGKLWPKSSFDRFGDDLTELILTFLNIEDKFRLECLSKTVRNVVFNKVLDLSVQYDNYRNKFSLSSHKERSDLAIAPNLIGNVLTKLKCLTTVLIFGSIDPNQLVLVAMADNCPNLQHLFFNCNYSNIELSFDHIVYLGQKCGTNIRSLKTNQYISDQIICQLLSFTPNLTAIQVTNLSTVLKRDKIEEQMEQKLKLLPKLQKIKFEYFDKTDLDDFVQQYSGTVVDIKTTSDAIQMIDVLHKFKRLEALKIGLICDELSTNSVLNGLKQLSANCLRLKRLKLSVTNLPSVNLFQLLARLSNLERLDISLHSHGICDRYNVFKFGSIADLKVLPRLRHLSLIMDQLCDQNLNNLDKFAPNLVSICLHSECFITDKSLALLSNMKCLQKVKIVCDSEPGFTISDSGVKLILDNCRHFRELELYCCRYNDNDHQYQKKLFDITKESVNAFRQRAQQKPWVRFRFTYRGEEWKEVEYLADCHSFPKNLILSFIV